MKLVTDISAKAMVKIAQQVRDEGRGPRGMAEEIFVGVIENIDDAIFFGRIADVVGREILNAINNIRPGASDPIVSFGIAVIADMDGVDVAVTGRTMMGALVDL